MKALKKKKTAAQPDIENALRVIETEIAGLQKLKNNIGQSFTEAVEAIELMKNAAIPGRLIVAGIGKSGHVARKIAATMASTGTPAYYIHPGEASHGDLGIIGENDVVLALSNSGENAELSDLIHYARRHGLTLIAITSNEASALARHSTIRLLLPNAPEACPNGLAPTTSTTMMMALGDALAVALLERKGLTPEQFRAFHPGGKLGQKLMKVSELMIPLAKMPLINDTAKMDDAIVLLAEKNLGLIVVVNKQKKLQGIITDGDLKRHIKAQDFLKKPVTKIMTRTPRTIESDALGVEAVNMMTKNPGKYLTSLIVTENGALAGLIRLQDCLQAGLV